MNFNTTTAIVTGAASGIGAAIAQTLVQAGARVHCFDVTVPAAAMPGITYHSVDVTDSASITAALSAVTQPIDILINNAGVMKRGNILEVSEADFDRLFAIHVKGSWLMVKHCRPKLSKQATIVQMSSRHALYFPSDPGLYALVKRTALSLAELVEQTYPQYRVKILCPGPVDTPLSRTECDDEAWEKKAKFVCTPGFLAERIVELIQSEKSKLIFDEKTCHYYFE